MAIQTERVEGYFEVVRPVAETQQQVADYLGESSAERLTTKYLEEGPDLLQGISLSQMCTDIPAPARRIFGVLESRPGERKVLAHWNIPLDLYAWYEEWAREAGAAVCEGAMYSAFLAGLMSDVNRNHLVLDVVPYTPAERQMDSDFAFYSMGIDRGCLDRAPNW